MLTSIYYYNYYKPYILRTNQANSMIAAKRKKITTKENFENLKDATFLLNKSLKSDVVNYAKQVSSSVVGIKDSSKHMIKNMERFNKNVYLEDVDSAKNLISQNLDELVGSFNSANDFLSTQSHSQSLSDFSDQMQSNLQYGKDKLSLLGLNFDQNGKLAYDQTYFNSLDQSKVNVAIGENLSIMYDLYQDAGEVLRTPMTEHMKFKSLGYYYNYKYGAIQSDTFKVIESGMLIDKVV